MDSFNDDMTSTKQYTECYETLLWSRICMVGSLPQCVESGGGNFEEIEERYCYL